MRTGHAHACCDLLGHHWKDCVCVALENEKVYSGTSFFLAQLGRTEQSVRGSMLPSSSSSNVQKDRGITAESILAKLELIS